jgi:hypothetical protein
MAELPGLRVPALAVTDGSADPVWIEMPCQGGYLYGRRHVLRLPYDRATADIARRRLRFDRQLRRVWSPLSMIFLLAAGVLLVVPGAADLPSEFRLACYAGALGVSMWTSYRGGKLTVAQNPELIGRLGVYLPAVSPAAAQQWVNHNPAVRLVSERPRWRRYPSRVYQWAAVGCASAGVGVWYFALEDGGGPIAWSAFVLLLGAAAALAIKALPVGFVRLGDTAG